MLGCGKFLLLRISRSAVSQSAKLPVVQSALVAAVRNRSNYYREKGLKKWMRWLGVRYPNLPMYALVFAFISPVFYHTGYFFYVYNTMPRDEAIDYLNKYRAVVSERLKHGRYFYIPFLTKDIAHYQDEDTQKVFSESDVRPIRTSKY